jgi:MFS family permease
MNLKKTFASLSVRNYRLFFYGQLISLVGTWMQAVAQSWLVLRLTNNNGFALGMVTAFQFLPLLLLSTHAGLVADRMDKRKVLIATQTTMGILAVVLAALTFGHVVQLWMVDLLALLLGVANAVDNPVRQTFVTEMVGPDSVANAVGLNSTIFNAARVAGPAVGAVLIKLFDVGPCFLINAASFVAVIIGLLMMRPDELFQQPVAPRASGQIREGLRYAWRTPVLRSTLFLVGVVGTLTFNFMVILPLLAKQTFHGDAGTYGLLSAMMGLGSLVGALLIAARSRATTTLLLGSCLLCGVACLGAALAPTLLTEIPALLIAGGASIAFVATANTTIQLTATPEMRGRVMALYVLLFLGTTPIGGPLVGWICRVAGARAGFLVAAGAALFAGVFGLLSAVRNGTVQLRPRGRPMVSVESPTEPATV